MKRWTVEELRAQAEAYLDWRSGEHPKGTTDTDRSKIKLFLDWLENQESR